MTSPDEIIQPIDLIIQISEIPDSGIERKLVLNDEQRGILAKQLDLSSFDKFECEWKLKSQAKRRYKLKGRITADLAQKSVLTLEPVPTPLSEEFVTEFWPIEQNDPKLSPELEIEYAEEVVEFYEQKNFNVGQVIYEQFIISLEQFPKSEDESFEWGNQNNDNESPPNPFAILKTLKDN